MDGNLIQDNKSAIDNTIPSTLSNDYLTTISTTNSPSKFDIPHDNYNPFIPLPSSKSASPPVLSLFHINNDEEKNKNRELSFSNNNHDFSLSLKDFNKPGKNKNLI